MEAAYAMYCLNKFHWKPSEFVELPRQEKAFVIACIEQRLAEEKKQNDKLKNKGTRRRH